MNAALSLVPSGAIRLVPPRWVLVSIGIHIAVMAAVKGLPEAPAVMPRLEVRLSLPMPVMAPAQPIAPASTEARPTPQLRETRPTPVLTRQETASPQPAAPVVAQAPAEPAPVKAAPAAPAPAAPVAVAPKAEEGVINRADLNGYGASLSRWLAQHKVYPRIAQLRGWQGQVQVRVRIAKKGSVMDVEVTRSSGYDILDRQAMDMVRAADPLPELPLSLRGQEFTLDVPITFRLEQAS